MPDVPTYDELERRIVLLERESSERQRHAKINSVLFAISSAVNTVSSLEDLYGKIHGALGTILDTENFYIALYNREKDAVTFPFCIDSVDEHYPPVIEVSKTSSLTAEVIATGAPLMVTKKEILARNSQKHLQTPCCTPSEIWLGVPLRIRNSVVGVMAVQHYHDRHRYDQTDLEVLVSVADQVAIALDRKQAEYALRRSESRFRSLLQEVASVAVQGYALDGTTRYWNRASEQVYGYTAGEALGRNLEELIIPPEMLEDFRRDMQYMADTGKPTKASELMLMRKDGSRVPVFSSHVIVEHPGQSAELFCIDIDLTELKERDKALSNSAAHLQSIFRAAPIGIGVVVDRKFQQVNEKLCTMTGYERQELLGRRSRMLYVDDAGFQYVGAEKYRQIHLYGTGTVETRWQRKDGVVIDVLLSSTPFDSADISKGVTFTALDITARKQTEKALADRERYFRALFENAGDAIFIENHQDRIIDANRRACELLGYSREELLQLSVPDVQAPGYRGVLGTTIRQELTDSEGVPFETMDITKDGRHIPVEVTTVSLTDDDNNLALSIVRDISERKKAEADRERLIQAIEQSKETIVITDPQGIIQYANPAFAVVSGYSIKEAIGRNSRIVRSEKHDDAFYAELWHTVAGGKSWKGTIVNQKKDGTLYTEQATISPVFDNDGNVINHIAVKLDITDQIRIEQEKATLEKQMVQAQKLSAVGQLAGGVAHDFNNMLAVIMGYAEMCLQSETVDAGVKDNLGIILQAAQKSSDIVRQLLAFARRQSIAPKVLDLNEIVENMLKILHRLIGEDIDLSWKPGAAIWPIRMDPSQIDQILANLCANARDAIKGVGKITIETATATFDADYCALHKGYEPGDFVVLTVTDNGCGMSEDLLDHVFEPFFTTKEVGQGTGLGLATVYGITKQNNGYISVYSEQEKGTSVKVFLPRHSGDGDVLQNAAARKYSESCGETVLLVEDAPELLQMCRTMLKRLGYHVLAAHSPQEALQLSLQERKSIQLLLTDLIMPEMNGRELATKLSLAHPHLKVLFMSGYTANVIAHHGVLEEGVHFIQKPFTIKDLAEKIRETLDAE
jgi:two-component system, cell cycle sensor histidine kinase and response regulator CckA